MQPQNENQVQLNLMERFEKYGYVSAGVSFLVLGMVVFIYGWVEFFLSIPTRLPQAVLDLLNELLLVVILLELFRTVINFLKSRAISLEPFLYVGIIAAVRRLLMIGAEMTLHENSTAVRFNQYLLDALVSSGVILAMSLALFLYRFHRYKTNGYSI